MAGRRRETQEEVARNTEGSSGTVHHRGLVGCSLLLVLADLSLVCDVVTVLALHLVDWSRYACSSKTGPPPHLQEHQALAHVQRVRHGARGHQRHAVHVASRRTARRGQAVTCVGVVRAESISRYGPRTLAHPLSLTPPLSCSSTTHLVAAGQQHLAVGQQHARNTHVPPYHPPPLSCSPTRIQDYRPAALTTS